uniref:Uncharacterized protein n=1 Tax=Tanacetum cinerariifolium TaxID=118510 RepID=A0A6L2P6M8_TANCI|nr:hypothetical protein [Tanacetum cinerariifolium]
MKSDKSCLRQACLLGTYHWSPKHQKFYGYASNMETSKDVYSRHKIIVVTSLMKYFSYSHLEEIIVQRQDDQLYKFREGDFKRLRRQDIENMLLLFVQNKLTNLNLEEHVDQGCQDHDPTWDRFCLCKIVIETVHTNTQPASKKVNSKYDDINIISFKNSFDALKDRDDMFETDKSTWQKSNNIESIVNDSDNEEVGNIFVEDRGKPMDGLVDDARKKAVAPPKKTLRKNGI